MCGIVGYIGDKNAKEVVLDGLEKLEYRGYDSSGIAVIKNSDIITEKKKGRLDNLRVALQGVELNSHIGIGHTRWATHGEPSDKNSHPHISADGTIAMVHNGIIENYEELKKELEKENIEFKSDTDSEVIANLIQKNYKGDTLLAVKKTIERLRGSYAIAVIQKDNPNEVICARKDSPLVIGVGENENIIASDVPAILKFTREVYFLESGDIAKVSADNVEIYDENLNKIERKLTHIEWSYEQATKNGYPHFMLKEIHEQPEVIKKSLDRIIHNDKINLDDILSTEEIKNIDRIDIVACGTAYHAGLQGKYALKKIANIEANIGIGSEYRYSEPLLTKNSVAIFISQSGETLDTLVSLKEAKRRGALTIAITNVVGSTISREADRVVYTMAGPEIAVASTKAYTTQVAVMDVLALYIAEKKGIIDEITRKKYIENLYTICDKMDIKSKDDKKLKEIAEILKNKKNGFYIGRGVDFATALEGSLKMKEITYIHTEAFPAGELKHGSIALIEKGTPTIVVAMQKQLIEKVASNIKEIKARGGLVITITREEDSKMFEMSDYIIKVANTIDIFAMFGVIIPLQLLAYYTSIAKNIDVDKPRNLAKSVTVE